MAEIIKGIVPDYLTKCFSSKISSKIERCIARAYKDGFTKEEILSEFHAWQVSEKNKAIIN